MGLGRTPSDGSWHDRQARGMFGEGTPPAAVPGAGAPCTEPNMRLVGRPPYTPAKGSSFGSEQVPQASQLGMGRSWKHPVPAQAFRGCDPRNMALVDARDCQLSQAMSQLRLPSVS